MSNNPPESDVRKLWQEQKTEVREMSVETMQATASKFQNTIRRRNMFEYAAALFVIVSLGIKCFTLEGLLTRTGAAVTILGVLYVVHQLDKHGNSHSVPAEAGLSGYIGFHRHELARQRDLLLGIWRWYLLPVVPGVIVFTVGRVIEDPAVDWGDLSRTAMGFAVVFGGIAWLNKRAARKLQLKIDELDELEDAA